MVVFISIKMLFGINMPGEEQNINVNICVLTKD